MSDRTRDLITFHVRRKVRARFKLEDILEVREMYSELDSDDHAFDTYVLTDLGREQIKDDRGLY